METEQLIKYALTVVVSATVAWFLARRKAAQFGTDPSKPLEELTSEVLARCDERERTLLKQLVAGDVSRLVSLLEQSGGSRWADRAYYVNLAAPWIPRTVLDQWCTREPSASTPLLLRGAHAIEWAWLARGGGRAHDVTDEQWASYRERLALARADLERAAELDARDPTPYVELLSTVDLEKDPGAVTRTYLADALERDPTSYAALSKAIALLGDRWFGDDETVLALAREHANRAPRGSELPMLVFHAHFEVWFYRQVFDEDAAAADRWLTSAEVRGELRAAYDASIGAADHKPSRLTHSLHNWAAFTFARMNDAELLARAVRPIRGRYTEYPWAYMPELLAKAKRAVSGPS